MGLARIIGGAALVCVTITLLAAPGASAAKLTASFKTPGCAGAPTWRIGYRMYFQGGGSLSRGAPAQAALRAAREYARDVGRSSECGVRVKVDVYDMGNTRWPGNYPRDADIFRYVHGYDGGFYRHPGPSVRGPGVAASTNFTDSEFPADNEDRQASRDGGRPWRLLVLHEWLHMVVGFYREVEWPTDDVHGACEHGYAEPCMVNASYFADMMTGQVREGGRLLGIRKPQWAQFGTPLNPRGARKPRLKIGKGRRRGARVWFRVQASESLAGLEVGVGVSRHRRRCRRSRSGRRRCVTKQVGDTRLRRLRLERDLRLSFSAPRRGGVLKLVVGAPSFTRRVGSGPIVSYRSIRAVRRFRRR